MSRTAAVSVASLLAGLLWPLSVAAQVPNKVACAGDALTKAPAAVAAAEAAFIAPWLERQPNWFTAFEARPTKRNIFDKSPEPDPATEAVKGIAWAHGLYCIANASPDGSEILVRYFARVAAFHEGKAWSQPFTEGLLASYLVRHEANVWRPTPVAGERSILLPNTVKSQPAPDALPPADAKAGIPCRSGTIWSGTRCMGL